MSLSNFIRPIVVIILSVCACNFSARSFYPMVKSLIFSNQPLKYTCLEQRVKGKPCYIATYKDRRAKSEGENSIPKEDLLSLHKYDRDGNIILKAEKAEYGGLYNVFRINHKDWRVNEIKAYYNELFNLSGIIRDDYVHYSEDEAPSRRYVYTWTDSENLSIEVFDNNSTNMSCLLTYSISLEDILLKIFSYESAESENIGIRIMGEKIYVERNVEKISNGEILYPVTGNNDPCEMYDELLPNCEVFSCVVDKIKRSLTITDEKEVSRYIFVFDEYGNEVSKKYYMKKWDKWEENWYKSSQTLYEYDEYGNWTKRKRYTVDSAGDERNVEIETREIIYYDTPEYISGNEEPSQVIVTFFDDEENTLTGNQEYEEEIFVAVEEEPQFPGGQAALRKYITDTLYYPLENGEKNIQGRVVVKMLVEKDGSISKVDVVRGLSRELDKEAIRVVQLMPRWTPGKINGTPVRSYYTYPISFKLQEGSDNGNK